MFCCLSFVEVVNYALLPSHAVPIRGAMISMQRALKNFGALHSDDFYKHFGSQIRSVPSSRLLCPLQFTIKTHKPVPSVRLIHSGGQHLFFPITVFAAAEFRKELANYTHVYGSTDAFLRDVKNVRGVQPCWSFATGDIRDFFTSGQFHRLVHNVTKPVANSTTRRVWSDLLDSVLSHQFVASSIFPGVAFQCTTGSGIGLNMSAEFCDLLFVELAEKSTVLKAEFRARYGIEFYGRYRDDVFVLFNHSNEQLIDQMFFALNKECDGVYEVLPDTFSTNGLPFLDVYVYFEGCRIAHALPRKKTNQRVYLHPDSFHHSSWPLAGVSRIARRCSSR